MSWRVFLCALIALALAAPQAHAVVIACDDFGSYTAGSALNGGGGGSGWTGDWASQATEVTVQAGVVPTFGKSMQIDTSGNDANIAHRSFPAQAGTVYVGLLLRTTGGWSGDDFLQLYVNDRTGGSDTVGVSGGIKNSSSSPYFARIDGSGSSTNSTTAFHADDVTQQVVLKLSNTGGDYDRTDIFVNRPTEATADATRTPGSSGVSQLSEFHVRTHSIESGELIFLDSVRIATTYDEALSLTPEPPPSPPIPATAYASSTHPINPNRPAANVVNGSGMSDRDGDGIPETHEANAYGAGINWMTNSLSVDTDPWLMLDFGQSEALDRMKVWNFNAEAGRTDRGVGTADLYVSQSDLVDVLDPDFDNTAIWTLLMEGVQLTEATGTDDYDTPDEIDLGIEARWLALDILSTQGSTEFVGLSEIQVFRQDLIPEPATLGLLALGALGLARRRKGR